MEIEEEKERSKRKKKGETEEESSLQIPSDISRIPLPGQTGQSVCIKFSAMWIRINLIPTWILAQHFADSDLDPTYWRLKT